MFPRGTTKTPLHHAMTKRRTKNKPKPILLNLPRRLTMNLIIQAISKALQEAGIPNVNYYTKARWGIPSGEGYIGIFPADYDKSQSTLLPYSPFLLMVQSNMAVLTNSLIPQSGAGSGPFLFIVESNTTDSLIFLDYQNFWLKPHAKTIKTVHHLAEPNLIQKPITTT